MNLLKKALSKFESPVPGSDSSHWKLSLWLHYSYNFLVVLIGGGVTFYGCRMIIVGIDGSVDWIIEISGSKNSVYNATPGIVISIIGLLIIFFGKQSTISKSN